MSDKNVKPVKQIWGQCVAMSFDNVVPAIAHMVSEGLEVKFVVPFKTALGSDQFGIVGMKVVEDE